MKKLILLLTLMNCFFLVQSQPWNLTGNSGTNPAVNFLGTTDNNPLRFRVTNVYAGEIDSVTARTSFGYGAGKSITTGHNNVAIGFKSLYSNTAGRFNTAIGPLALYSNTNAISNVAVGYRALYSNNGTQNAAVGTDALTANTSGYGNTAVGDRALLYNTTGYYNSAFGMQSLLVNTTGVFNTAAGVGTLAANTTGSFNTGNGSEALSNNITGSYNTANGYRSLIVNNGSYNTSSGYQSLYYNSTGWYNTAQGSYALYSSTTGQANTADGYQSLWQNTTGSMNTAHGYYALASNTTSGYNTAVGTYALLSTTTSQYNTAIGYYAGGSNNLGWNNTMLGAQCNTNAAGLYNCIAIGQAVTNTASSQARIGNSSTNSIGGYANWTNISDGRYKKDINQNVKGLEFIMKLQPITYHLNISGISKKLNETRNKEMDEFTQKAIVEKEKILFSGFVAQDVEKAAQETGYDFSGVDKPKNENDFYGLRYAEFVVPLVKAVQEQQQIINELIKQNTDLQQRVITLEKNPGNSYTPSGNSKDLLTLWPNPSNDIVFIKIIADIESRAAVKVFDNKGTLVKEYRTSVLPGSNQMSIDMKGMASGAYHFSAEWNNGKMKKTIQVVKQ